MNDVIAHDLGFVTAAHVLQTHATNPFLGPATMEAALTAYLEARPKHDSLFTVTARQSRFYWPDGRPINHSPDELLRTQDLAPIYEENSSLYVFSPASFRESGGRRIGRRPLMFPMSKLEALDIDDEEDFALAEALAAGRGRPERMIKP
jgi:CMP-N-acetylneuraminic acid synthetase